MIKQTIDLFRRRQYMNQGNFEIYNYSNKKIPKIIPHRHNFYELYYPLCDRVDYFISNKIYHIKKGDFLLIPPGLLHYPSEIFLNDNDSYSRIVFWCSIDFFDALTNIDPDLNKMWDIVISNKAYHFHPYKASSAHLLNMLRRLMTEHSSDEFVSDAMCYSIILEIFVLLNRIVDNTKNFEKSTPTSKLFDNIIYYIHVHLSDDLTLDTLSEQFFISKGYISKLFREYMGIPVHQYILSRRLECCITDIEKGVSITDIPELYGFKDYSNFYRAFKNAFLISPKEYQKQHTTNNSPEDSD